MSRHLILALVLVVGCSDNLTHPDRAYYDAPPETPACVPNLDGVFEAHELPFRGASYVVSGADEQPAVNVAGVVDERGVRVWDFSIDRVSDRRVDVPVEPVTGRWYADAFDASTVVAPFDAAASIEAVYTIDESAVWLHGFASADAAPPDGQTLIPYDEPVALYRFPFERGSEWVGAATATGTLNGYPYVTTDTYAVRVDASGRVELPDLAYDQAHRVRIDTTIDGSLAPVMMLRRVLFLFECVGEVARAESLLDEPDPDFESAAQTRRLGD